MQKRHAIVVAGGRGARFGSAEPKQFLLLHGRPVLLHAMERFFAYDSAIGITLALPEGQLERWRALARQHGVTIPHAVVAGGETRFHSVQRALKTLAGSGGDALVAVHDGVRPLVSGATIAACFEAAERTGAAVPVTPLTDSLRRLSPTGESVAVNREDFCAVQTPQVFRLSVLREAYGQAFCGDFTDDASVVERAGYRVALVAGNPENIKITKPADLLLARELEAKN
ncbi:MAG: 2-C-methyl-D-erythritol 4-phosphate cytidylyltransferase [Prevotellaceae bacterium]|nr:2-C-methyl-D-erythritol 4-phosphate cytidylyltransferase [Prevotellaceae bacterium]